MPSMHSSRGAEDPTGGMWRTRRGWLVAAVSLSATVLVVLGAVVAGLASGGGLIPHQAARARSGLTTSGAAQAVSSCHFLSAPPGDMAAFCDSFDQPMGTGNRAGDLNGIVWGVSRIIAGSGGQNYPTGTNPGQGFVDNFAPIALNKCGTTVTVYADQDVAACHGQVVEGVNDDGSQTILAMYPKQPFDIAGRTGTVVFDVSADSAGGHAAWPTFVYTDQPVPAPYSNASGIQTSARNSFGFTLDSPDYRSPGTPCGGNGTSVGSMFITSNYQLHTVPFSEDNCVVRPSSPMQLNHFEVRISQSAVTVYGTDPGSTTLKQIAHASGLNLPLTRGLIWMEDNHYNGDKDGYPQQSHTFGWDNVGFDGPVLARDLAFDAPDAKQLDNDSRWPGHPAMQLGYRLPATLQVPGVTNIAQAAGALVTFNWQPTVAAVPTVSINGNPAIQTAWPFSGDLYMWRTIAVPVPLSQIHAGTNTVVFTDPADGSTEVANMDIILVGAGGVPTCIDPSNCTGSPPPPDPGNTPTPAPTPVSINKVPCTVVLDGHQQSGTCSGTFTP